MPVQSSTLSLSAKGFTDVVDITGKVRDIVSSGTIDDGIATVFVPGSTAGVTTIEYESGAVTDLKEAAERLFPQDIHYAHDARWGDGNGFSHIRSAMLGTSLTIPFTKKTLLLGTWQQIVLVDFDNRPRRREVIVQIVG
ncbi:MAG TPA: secondary thiamine-phosphate synthase enzyme YjbQ [Bacteroidota bacterium]|nr:secondary thiamine-phosphate synthase enzyme YjbQ [Bacteroidota bacterium]